MSDLVVVALIPAKDGAADPVRDALTTLVEQTRAEDGCLAYDLYESKAQAGTFVTVERWESQEHLDAHLASPHVAAAMQAAGESLAGAPDIHALTPVDVA